MSSSGSQAGGNVYIDKTAFDELLKYSKQNGDFTKDIVGVMQERADLELSYQKALVKLSVRANKVNPTTGGTFLNAWKTLCKQIEGEAESHKKISAAINTEIIKPMKKVLETRAKGRKSADAPVDKATKTVADRKNDAFKAQKTLLTKTKEFEATATGSQATTNSKGKELSDKERNKLSSKHGKTSEAVVKADREYLKAVKTAEQARCQRIVTINHAAFAMQKSESDFMDECRNLIIKFADVLGQIIPLVRNHYDSMKNAFASVSPVADVQNAIANKGSQTMPAEQILYDCFEDDLNVQMSVRNRNYHLQRKLENLDTSLETSENEQREAQRKASSSKSSDKVPPNMTYLQMIHDKDMINLWNASRYRIICAMATVNSKPKPSNPVAGFIKSDKDKSGTVKSILTIPRDQKGQATLTVSKVPASGVQYDPRQEENTKTQPVAATPNPVAAAAAPAAVVPVAAAAAPPPQPPPEMNNTKMDDDDGADSWDDEPDSGEKYRALYDFEPSGEGEIALKEGDIVIVTRKDDDGWFYGSVGSKSGQFPESYVKKVDDV